MSLKACARRTRYPRGYPRQTLFSYYLLRSKNRRDLRGSLRYFSFPTRSGKLLFFVFGLVLVNEFASEFFATSGASKLLGIDALIKAYYLSAGGALDLTEVIVATATSAIAATVAVAVAITVAITVTAAVTATVTATVALYLVVKEILNALKVLIDLLDVVLKINEIVVYCLKLLGGASLHNSIANRCGGAYTLDIKCRVLFDLCRCGIFALVLTYKRNVAKTCIKPLGKCGLCEVLLTHLSGYFGKQPRISKRTATNH